MSTLKTNTLANAAGTKSVPVDTVVSGSAKAWVNFNGTGTVAIRASFNVSSITDNGVGDYTVNFTSAMTDANYGLLGTPSNTSFVYLFGLDAHTLTTSTARFRTHDYNSLQDTANVTVAIFR